jgi:ABC-type phosphate transport system substrate-binding protein
MRLFPILALALGWSLPCAADDLLVIAHPDVAISSLTPAQLSSIYLLKVISWQGGENIVPVNREASSAARKNFSDAVLHQPPHALDAYWNQMHFKGKVPPMVQESDQAVLAFVQKVPGAIGYVSASVAPKNVKILAKVP